MQDKMPENQRKANSLIHESSPYLLQHAYNPINWLPWGKTALDLAKKENKPIIVSIGYSACHWCHVMEHESFEDSSVAQIMNEHFVCIKVDREERPDIDQVYMDAVQLMTNRGGWPLNCFITPDGKPFYGGTYFPKEKWKSILLQLAELYQNEPEKILDYANKLTQGIRQNEIIDRQELSEYFDSAFLKKGLENWQKIFDVELGGNNQAPKFPMPNNYEFLLQVGFFHQDQTILDHVYLTLDKMAYGGIYDQIGGGFARYSTDMEWKAPHFEKMLYDNAQLISLYAKAFRLNPKETYKNVVYESVDFVKRELLDQSGAFYSALDADSEGEEGKYYVWEKEELKHILREDFQLISEYYNINSIGYWENDKYIFVRTLSDYDFAVQNDLNPEDWKQSLQRIKKVLLGAREKRVKPGLDDKSLTSWNALMISGLVEAYKTFKEQEFLDLAIRNTAFILKHQLKEDGSLWHSYKKGKSSINGYLEDYCFLTEALIALYEVTFDEGYLQRAKKLMDFTIAHFHNEKNDLFFFTSDLDAPLIARKIEYSDNVIPASNSSLAKALFKLGSIFYNDSYLKLSKQMLQNIMPQMNSYLPYYSNWGILYNYYSLPYYEVAIVGENYQTKRSELQGHYLPNAFFIGCESESQLKLLEDKTGETETLIYVCENKTCQLPTSSSEIALKQIHW